jgi:Na+/H+ antiporter NhaD/arsenite permease-like protein
MTPRSTAIIPEALRNLMTHANTALIIFVLTYVVIAIGKLPGLRLDRAGAAFAGAVAMVVGGALSERQARDAIDYHTLALLLGMMIVIANLRLAGAFRAFTGLLLRHARSGYGLLAMTVASSGILAAFFINDVVCIALTPLLIDSCELLEIDAIPFLIALATASNIGSAATITGNPQNMIVASFAHLHYLRFAAKLAPVAIAGLVADYVIIALVYRHSLSKVRSRREPSRAHRPRAMRALVIKSTVVAIVTLIGFAMGFPTHLVALGAGAVLLFTRRLKPERVFKLIDWTTLLMFAGLFVVVGGLEATGIDADAVKWIGVARLANPINLTDRDRDSFQPGQQRSGSASVQTDLSRARRQRTDRINHRGSIDIGGQPHRARFDRESDRDRTSSCTRHSHHVFGISEGGNPGHDRYDRNRTRAHRNRHLGAIRKT